MGKVYFLIFLFIKADEVCVFVHCDFTVFPVTRPDSVACAACSVPPWGWREGAHSGTDNLHWDGEAQSLLSGMVRQFCCFPKLWISCRHKSYGQYISWFMEFSKRPCVSVKNCSCTTGKDSSVLSSISGITPTHFPLRCPLSEILTPSWSMNWKWKVPMMQAIHHALELLCVSYLLC